MALGHVETNTHEGGEVSLCIVSIGNQNKMNLSNSFPFGTVDLLLLNNKPN